MKKLTTDEFIEKAIALHGNKYDYSDVHYINSHSVVNIFCKQCGRYFQQTPNGHLNGRGCTFCNATHKKTTEEFIGDAQKIHGDKYDYSKVDYINNETKVLVICKECGAEFFQKPSNHLNGQGCPKCGVKKRVLNNTYTKDEILAKAKEIYDNRFDYSKFIYNGISEKGLIKCNTCGREFNQSMNEHINQHHGCPFCGKANLLNSRKITTEEFVEKAKKIHGNTYDYSLVKYVNYDTEVEIICPKHGVFMQTPDAHLQGKGCQKCGVRLSKNEDEIANFIREVDGVEIVQQERTLIKPYEIDIYVPDKKIGIEFNGLLWHSEKYKEDRNYHLNKTIECNKKGIRLIQIFEDEYINHKEIVLSKIAHILGKCENLPKIMGRKCSIKEIIYKEASEFLNKNHIQGAANATVYLGAYYGKMLIGVMSFMKEKFDVWNLNRFATDINYNCCGVGGKLFKYFIRKYSPTEIKSFADRRWSENSETNFYRQIGFNFDSYLSPDYRYYKPNGVLNRLHKFNFRKEILHKKYNLPLSMTESEMIKELGYYKIWDCGLIKYIWKKENL